MRTTILLTALFALSGCIGASIEGGSIDGTDFAPSSAFHLELNDAVIIFVSTHPDACTRFQESDARVSDIDTLTFSLSDIDIDGFSIDLDPVKPGTYPVREGIGDFEGKGSVVSWEETNEDCETEEVLRAEDGEVELIDYDERGVATGTFDLEMDNDEVIGNFRAAFCDIDEDEIDRDPGDCDP